MTHSYQGWFNENNEAIEKLLEGTPANTAALHRPIKAYEDRSLKIPINSNPIR